MKNRLWIIIMLILLTGGAVFAGGQAEDPLQGTWYGGSNNEGHAGFKYHYTIIGTEPDRWCIIADRAYAPECIGATMGTVWTGEITKSGDRYEVRLISLTTNDTANPPTELPVIQGVRGYITLTSENTASAEYDIYGVWAWGQTPFIDNAVTWIVEPDTVLLKETLTRMSMAEIN